MVQNGQSSKGGGGLGSNMAMQLVGPCSRCVQQWRVVVEFGDGRNLVFVEIDVDTLSGAARN